VSRSACGLLANNENYGVPPASQQYFSLTVNQYQPPTTASRTEENFKLNLRISPEEPLFKHNLCPQTSYGVWMTPFTRIFSNDKVHVAKYLN